MKKNILVLFFILTSYFLPADSGFTLKATHNNGSFRMFYFSEKGNIIDVPEEYLSGLNFKGTDGYVSSDGNFFIYSAYDWATDLSSVFVVNLSNGRKSLLFDDPNYFYFIMDLSPDNKKALFGRNNKSGYSICIINTDGTGLRELDSVPGGDYFPYANWLDSSSIVYVKRTGDVDNLYTMNTDNLNNHFITDRISSPGDLSNNGELFFYKYDGADKFGYINVFTEAVTFPDGVIQSGKNHKWSPDSSRILFEGQQDDNLGRFNIYIYNVRSGNIIRLTQTSAWHERCLGWFGSNVVYAESIPSDEYTANIYYMDINAKNRTSFTSQKNVKYDLAMACPLLSVYNGSFFNFLNEVIMCNTRQLNEALEQTVLPLSSLQDNRISIKIEEALNEITYLNEIYISIGSNIYRPLNNIPELYTYDNSYLELRKDNSVVLDFLIAEKPSDNIILNCTGYYHPFY